MKIGEVGTSLDAFTPYNFNVFYASVGKVQVTYNV